ncbi:MAG TPA: L,D-transpeptidase [Gaiellaceae bacterium]|nr:L,D-transpeptidase [Gaiellaceae bacterium]
MKVALVAGGLLAAGAIGLAATLALRGTDSAEPPPAPTTSVRHEPTLERVTELAARVPPGNQVALRARPNGRILTLVGARTEFGSPQTLAVAFRKGDWLAVRSPALGNEQLGWVRAAPLRLLRRPVELEVDLSRRELSVRDANGVERRISVTIGAPDTPTPPGEYYVTDKLPGADFGSYFGCCILALSGRQPNLPQGWSGGDRLAIHGAPTPTFDRADSNGCLHADEADLRYLMKAVPLGSAVEIHA